MSKRRPSPGDYEKWMEFQTKFAKMKEEMDSLPPLFTRSPHTSDNSDSDPEMPDAEEENPNLKDKEKENKKGT